MSKTSDYTALGPLVGFVYQIYYFLYRLLTIQDGETVSLEKIDDVGLETGEKRTYFQLKHSINSKPSAVKCMTERDTDLWKILNMWVNIVKKQGDDVVQRQWIAKSEFVLVSNKNAENNRFFELVEAYKKDDSNWDELEKYVSNQAAKEPKEESVGEEKKNIYLYTKNVNDFALKKELLKHIAVVFESDDELRAKIDGEIQYGKLVPVNRVLDVRNMLIGDITDSVVKGITAYTKESFYAANVSLFDDMRTRKFIPLNRKVELPERPMEQTFIKQLQGVDDPLCNDPKEIVRMTEQKLRFENDYHAANEASGAQMQRQFEENMHTEWKNITGHRTKCIMYGRAF